METANTLRSSYNAEHGNSVEEDFNMKLLTYNLGVGSRRVEGLCRPSEPADTVSPDS
jgi:hypothetical protein